MTPSGAIARLLKAAVRLVVLVLLWSAVGHGQDKVQALLWLGDRTRR